MKHSVDMSLPGIGEDFSHLDTIIAELPELFYAEILPKLDRQTALNLAQVNKTWRDAVWSVDGFRSMEAHWGPRPARPYWIPPSHWIPPMPIFWAVHHGNVPGQGPPEVRGGREQTLFWDPTVVLPTVALRSL